MKTQEISALATISMATILATITTEMYTEWRHHREGYSVIKICSNCFGWINDISQFFIKQKQVMKFFIRKKNYNVKLMMFKYEVLIHHLRLLTWCFLNKDTFNLFLDILLNFSAVVEKIWEKYKGNGRTIFLSLLIK